MGHLSLFVLLVGCFAIGVFMNHREMLIIKLRKLREYEQGHLNQIKTYSGVPLWHIQEIERAGTLLEKILTSKHRKFEVLREEIITKYTEQQEPLDKEIDRIKKENARLEKVLKNAESEKVLELEAIERKMYSLIKNNTRNANDRKILREEFLMFKNLVKAFGKDTI